MPGRRSDDPDHGGGEEATGRGAGQALEAAPGSLEVAAAEPVDPAGGDRSRHDLGPAFSPTAHPPAGGTIASGAPEAPGAPGAPGERGKGPRQIRAGDTLGRYEIGDELGEGGMATVFRARDRELRRDVAVKVLFPHLARRVEIVRRFHREARAAAGLEHPNLLRIYDVGGAEGDDPPYIVMELIRGRTLLQEIETRGAMLAEIAACIGALLADALSAAHAAGVIHRDVKPANVLIAPGGRLLLADFGVARLETEDSLVTRTGALLGTPAYMSPEQASGDIATARSDLYSLGATIYQLATGALPYGGSPAKVMSQIATGQLVPPVRRRPACGADLSRLIAGAMANEPGERPASATVIAAELRGFAAAGGLGDATEELSAYFADPEGFLAARTPVVVGALVTAATAAVAADKLPRAMALADRASALAPTDPAVAALIQSVIAGGHASRRNRGLALGGLALVLASGVVALGVWIARSPDVVPPGTPGEPAGEVASASHAPGASDAQDASDAPGAGDALAGVASRIVASRIDASRIDASRIDASRIDTPRGLGEDAGGASGGDERGPRSSSVVDARRPSGPSGMLGARDSRRPRDPGELGRRDAGASVIDAALAEAPITPEVPRPAPDAALASGRVIVRNDLWCSVWIDGSDRGSRRNEPLEVAAGHHVVRCVNPAGEWTQDVDVAAGTTRTLTGTLRRELTITLEVDASIDGTPHARGTVVTRKPGIVEVSAGGQKKFITLRASCTLRGAPELGCYL